MELPIEQLSKILKTAQRILITGPSNPSVDVISTAIAWRLFLTGKNKQVDLVLDGNVTKLKFLPPVEIFQQLENLGKFRITLDMKDAKVKQLSYDINNDKLEIDIVPEGGNFKDSDVSTGSEGYKYDLVITLGAANLESLGKVFTNHRDFFFQTPIINVDRSLLNENFGQLNIVESSLTSLAELSYRLLKNNLDKDIMTALLAGMITATNSFQSPQTTPETLELASQLIIKGADRVAIIEELYRTKDIDTLKNWGRVLSRLRKSGNIITSFLKNEEAESLPQDWQEMVKDLILSTPKTQVAIIFYQIELNQTEAWLYSISNVNIMELAKDLSPEGWRQFAKVTIDRDLEGAKEFLTEKIQDKLDIINRAE